VLNFFCLPANRRPVESLILRITDPAGRNLPTPTPPARAGEGRPMKQQVGAPGERLPGDYNRNRKQTRLTAPSGAEG